MELHKIFQLIRRHLFLLIIIPILMAVLVYIFTRSQSKTYSSEATIYTGIATGYSLESTTTRSLDYFSTNIQFDNLINLINSGQTIENTAIRLLAQGVSLEASNPQYISRDNYEALQKIVPSSVQNLVVKNGKMGLVREREDQIRLLQSEIEGLEQTIQEKKSSQLLNEPNTGIQQNIQPTSSLNRSQSVDNSSFHTVRPGETIYTIAGMYGVSAGEIIDRNNLRNNSVSVGQNLIIQKEIPTEFLYHIIKPGESIYSIAKLYSTNITDIRRQNNLYSDELTVGTRLMIRSVNPTNSTFAGTNLNFQANSSTKLLGPEDAMIDLSRFEIPYKKDPVVPLYVRWDDFYNTVDNFTNYYNSSDSNFIYELLHYDHEHYSIEKIKSNAQVFRLQNSDMIRVRYQTDDPGICQQTLKILVEVFIKNYTLLKANETDAVVDYYRRKVEEADAKLQDAEDRLLEFNKEHNIINYYEQSKYIAAQKEDLDLYYQNEQIRLASASAALRELNTKLTGKDSIYTKSDVIIQKMKRISEISELIIINEISNEYDPYLGTHLAELKAEAKKIKDEVTIHVDQLYMYSRSNEGIPIKELLVEYLNNNITFVEAQASLRVLSSRKQDFTTIYQIFAPLGAMLTRIQREISVAESAYLEFLHSFNVAKMEQQNNLLSTNIKIVDEPSFPLTSNQSRAKILVIVAALMGFFIVAFIILMLEYFDSTIKSPETVEKYTKLKLAGAFPILEPGKDTNYISNRLIEMLLQHIKHHISYNSIFTSEKPYLILLFSTQRGVGKTTIGSELIKKLRSYGEKVLFLNYSKSGEENTEDDLDSTIIYKLDNRFVEIKHINELLVSNYLRQDNYKYDYIFLEIPAIIYNSYPLELMNSVDVPLLISTASDNWRNADITALKMMQEVLREKPMVVLNQTELYALEDIVNDIPEKRERSLRRKFVNVVTYPFRLKVRVRVD